MSAVAQEYTNAAIWNEEMSFAVELLHIGL